MKYYKEDLQKEIEIAMVRANVAYLTDDVVVLGLNKMNEKKWMVDVVVKEFNMTSFIVRIIIDDEYELVRLHNVYNIDCFMSSHLLKKIDEFISELTIMLFVGE